jgi:protein O-mannosyl-transferase
LVDYADFLLEIRKDDDRAEELLVKALRLEPNSVTNLYAYAFFLTYVRKEYDRAEVLFKKAYKLEPLDGNTLGGYASFLMDIRKDYEKADHLFRDAIAVDPITALWFTDYAKLRIIQGNLDEAKKLILQAFDYNKEKQGPELQLTLWFYCYAIFYRDFPESETSIKVLLAQGVTSNREYLKDVLESARRRGHPDFEKLSEFAKKITATSE